MSVELIKTGKTVDEAVDAACEELGRSRDDVSYEIIDLPQKRLFGFSPAKVKVTVNEDIFSVRDLLRSEEPEESRPEPPKEAVTASAEPEKRPESRPEPEKKRPERRSEPKNEPRREAQPRQEAPAPTAEPELPAEEVALDALPDSAKVALGYLTMVAEGLGAKELTYRAVTAGEGGIRFIVDGEDSAILIGRRGETMDAIQYLCLLVSNRAGGEYCKISIDVAGYRKKREKTLEQLAARVAGKVLKTKYSQTLEPMNPYERRIVHSAVQNIEGVKSESIGEDPNRRVVISLISGGKSPRGGDRRRPDSRDGRYDRRRDNRRSDERRSDERPQNDRPRRDSRPPMEEAPREERPAQPAAPKRQPSEQETKKLYGRIDF